MGEMNSFSLLEFYDELIAAESILYEKGKDLENFYDYATALKTHAAQKKTTATHSLLEDQLTSQLEETKSLVFKLEQKIRILTIQCDEEKETRVDLEIENIKLKKEIRMLRSTLESINNNVYDEEFADDLDLTDIAGADETLQDMDSIQILSDSTMNRSPLLSVTMTPAPIVKETPVTRKVQFSTDTITKKVHPPSNLGKCSTDTYTKKTRPRPGLPVVKIEEPSTPQSKQVRRRSRSVDFFVGEKTVITPQRCQICLKSARERRPEDSPTLPWCPHQDTDSTLETTTTSIIATPRRPLNFKTLAAGSRGAGSLSTSTPLRRILKQKSPQQK